MMDINIANLISEELASNKMKGFNKTKDYYSDKSKSGRIVEIKNIPHKVNLFINRGINYRKDERFSRGRFNRGINYRKDERFSRGRFNRGINYRKDEKVRKRKDGILDLKVIDPSYFLKFGSTRDINKYSRLSKSKLLNSVGLTVGNKFAYEINKKF